MNRFTLFTIGMAGLWSSTNGVAAEPVATTTGHAIFQQRCVVCHGQNADGKSQLGELMKPRPANLRISTLTNAQREAIVRKGGQAVGRSSGMPAWETELSDADIAAVIGYVASLGNTAGNTVANTR